MIIERNIYLNKLIASMHNGLVKVITGPRRSGKSFLLFEIFKNYLLNQGINSNHIIEIKLDDIRNIKYRNPMFLSEYLDSKIIHDGSMNYLLIDEIQFVQIIENPYLKDNYISFYDILNSYISMNDIDVYVTGSNSHMLSTDIATEFRGRDWQIRIHPLSFREFLSSDESNRNKYDLWNEYLIHGGLPGCAILKDDISKQNYLKSVYNTSYIKDVIDRYNLRANTIISDVTKVIASTVGSLVNPDKISKTFLSKEKQTASASTIKLYLSYLENSFLISEVKRYNLNGRSLIGGGKKYYFEDMGLRNTPLDFKMINIEPHLMENIIYNELIIQDFNVFVGSIDTFETNDGKRKHIIREIDFIAEKNGKKYYIQSALEIPDIDKMKQEKASLISIKDNFKKIIITKSIIKTTMDDDGIIIMNLFDFLLIPGIIETF